MKTLLEIKNQESTKLNNMEKTFEELFYDRIGNFDTECHELIEKWEFIKFLQQVREATIAECVEILRNPNIPKSRMEALPTDRIKTEK